jgi:hypothetical protein
MKSHDARLTELESRTPPKPNARHEQAFVTARTDEELDMMVDGWHVLIDGGDVSDLDPSTVALFEGWHAARLADAKEARHE